MNLPLTERINSSHRYEKRRCASGCEKLMIKLKNNGLWKSELQGYFGMCCCAKEGDTGECHLCDERTGAAQRKERCTFVHSCTNL